MSKTHITPIGAAIAAIMLEVPAIGKDGRNKDQGFSFRKLDDILDFIHPLFAKVGVVMVPVVQNVVRDNWLNSKSNRVNAAVVTVSYRFTASDSTFIEATVVGESNDSGDKSVSKAMSMALKTALAQTFLIPTHEIEADEQTHEDAPQKAPQHAETLEGLIAIRDGLLAKNRPVPSDILGKISVLKAEQQEASEQATSEPVKPTKPAPRKTPKPAIEEVIDVTPDEVTQEPQVEPEESLPVFLKYTIQFVKAPAYFGKTLAEIGAAGIAKIQEKWVVANADKIAAASNEAMSAEAKIITRADEYFRSL